MSDEIKEAKVDDGVKRVVLDTKAELSIAPKDSPFVTENDTFDVIVQYYKVGRKIIAEEDADFDPLNKSIKTLSLVIKYPSQGDAVLIHAHSKQAVGESKNPTQITTIVEYTQTEVIRLLNLVRKWDATETLDNEHVMNLPPNIIKAILSKIRNEIGTDGII